MNPRCIILSGPSGFGKSTLAEKLKAAVPEGQSFICSADNFFVDEGGFYAFDPKLLPQAHKECWLDFLNVVSFRTPLVIVDNTNLSGWEISPYTHASAMGYDTKIMKLACDTKVAAARNVHGVPAKVVEGMASRHGTGWCPFWIVEKVVETTLVGG